MSNLNKENKIKKLKQEISNLQEELSQKEKEYQDAENENKGLITKLKDNGINFYD